MLSARQSEFFCRKKEGKRANDEFGSIKPPPLAQPPPPPPQKKPFSLGQASDVIPKLLGARARVLTTRCVLNELKMMGPEFRAAAIDARKGAALHYCGHGGSDGDVGDVRRRQQQQESGEAAPAVSKNEPCLPAAACLASCVGPAGNAEHFIVATQDRALRAALGEAPAGAAIFLTARGAQFEPPTEAQRRHCAAAGAADRGALPGERAPATGGCGGGSEALEEVARAARRAWAKDTAVAFRRNRAKGPNPLSVKKKKKKIMTKSNEAPAAVRKEAAKKKPEEKEARRREEQGEEKKSEKAKARQRPRRRKREGGETAAAAAASAGAN